MIESVKPVTVWAVRLGRYADEVKGKLALEREEERLTFHDDEGEKTEHISLQSIRRVKRSLGSPVLQVDFATSNGMARIAFFFARPPPFQPSTLMGSGRRRKRQNIQVLMGENATVRDLVKKWQNAVREAAREARG
jgi:hypothetical protein